MTTTTTPKIKAAAGVYLVRLIENTSKLNLGETKGHILKGEIIDVGVERTHDSGGILKPFNKLHDVIYFFSYAEGADWFEEDKEKYYTVLFNDVRAFTNDN